jgi:hypothetical protein
MYIYVQGDVYIILRRVYISGFVYRLAGLLEYQFAQECGANAEAKAFGNFKMKRVFIKLHFCSGINLIMDFLCFEYCC